MSRKYRIDVVFEKNDTRLRNGFELKHSTVVEICGVKNKGTLLVAEVLTEFSYGECKKVLLATDIAGGAISSVDHFLVKNMFKFNSINLVAEFMDKFEIDRFTILRENGEKLMSLSMCDVKEMRMLN